MKKIIVLLLVVLFLQGCACSFFAKEAPVLNCDGNKECILKLGDL